MTFFFLLTFVSLGARTHSVINLQFTLQGVDQLPALAQLLLQQRHLMLQPGQTQTIITV